MTEELIVVAVVVGVFVGRRWSVALGHQTGKAYDGRAPLGLPVARENDGSCIWVHKGVQSCLTASEVADIHEAAAEPRKGAGHGIFIRSWRW